jgi:hypothetical protein
MGALGYLSDNPTIHSPVAILAFGIALLLVRQMRRRHLIFGSAIGTFEGCHTVQQAPALTVCKGLLTR